MDKLQIEPLNIEPLDTGALSIEPLNIEPLDQGKTSLGEDVAISFAGVGNTVDRGWSGLAGSLASLFSPEEADEIFRNMEARVKQRSQWANPEKKEQGFGGKLAGTVATLPMQILSLPASPFETGQTMVEHGETLPRALAGTGVDTAGNIVGMALPGSVGKTLLGKAASGAAINAAQDTAVRGALSALSENESTKQALGPSLETAALAGVVGGGVGAMHYRPETTSKPVLEPSRPISELLNELDPEAKYSLEDLKSLISKRGSIEDQLPLLDLENQGKMANPYEAQEGYWVTDENGIPVRADLSMDAANVQEPLQMHLWGDENESRLNPVGQAADLLADPGKQEGVPLTQAMDSMDWAHRRGAINSELRGDLEPSGELQAAMAEANSRANAVPFRELQLKPREPQPDTIQTPRSPETIAKKTELSNKAAAIKLKGTQYDRVTTVEEALAGIDGKADMSKVGANSLRSGSEGALRTNIRNKPLNFVRTALQEARNVAEKNSKLYITNRDTGIIRKLKDLTQDERNSLAQHLLEMDRKQVEITPEEMSTRGMNEKQQATALRIKEALDARYASAVESLGAQGFEPFAPRKGYFPSMFSGAYSSLVGYTDAKGKWHTMGIAQADTKLGHSKAVESYKKMGDKYAETIPLDRKGLNTTVGRNKTYNGFTDLVNQLAKHDEGFGKAKAIADQHAADQIASLYRFDVHELKKSGVRGSLGDRPWLSRNENTKQMFEALVNYLEEGFRYDSLQKPLNDINTLTTDPKLKGEMPNTTKFIEDHVNKITGQNLNPVGAGVNWVVDKAADQVGLGAKAPRAFVNAITQASTTLMMGMGNLGFAAMQLTQLPTMGIMESAAARQVLGLSHTDVAKSWTTVGGMYFPVLSMAKMLDKPELAKHVPQHIQDAYRWAEDTGMFDYSEAELVKNLNKSKGRVIAESIANASISVPEKVTRPPMFIILADMFHKAGFRGEDAFLRAQAATDYAMTNYHPDERPGLYTGLGEAGKFLGSLSTFKHNLLEQFTSRTVNADKQTEAFIVGTAIGIGLYGLGGLPGSQEASTLAEKLTGKSLRELLLDDARKPNVALDGIASYMSGIDLQSRVAMSSMLPDSPLNAAPHISNTWNILSSAVEAAAKRDEASLRAFAYKAMPASARNVYEAKVLTDENGWVRDPKGELKVERPRTPQETSLRATMGLRPLDERINSDTTWTQNQRNFDTNTKLRALGNRFAAAVRLGDRVDGIIQEYQALGGDPQELLNQIPTILETSGKTPKERAQGTPKDSLSSIRRYRNLNP